VLEAIAALRQGRDDVVTVVLPEQFKKRSLMAATQRAQFRLKFRLLTEPSVVVADVPAVTSERRPEGKVPKRLHLRVLADTPDPATQRAVDYARTLREPDLRLVHFGGPAWGENGFGLPVDVEPQPGRLGDAVLSYVRRLTDDPDEAVNVILPERLRESLPRLRGRRALAVKRCLLFEPHVILSSVPTQTST
jgi:hypothetical protein